MSLLFGHSIFHLKCKQLIFSDAQFCVNILLLLWKAVNTFFTIVGVRKRSLLEKLLCDKSSGFYFIAGGSLVQRLTLPAWKVAGSNPALSFKF